jgi:hypothetical protein
MRTMPESREDLIRAIEERFADVRLDDGVTLHEANVIDDYGTDEERMAARRLDNEDRWQEIPDKHIEDYPAILCFVDLKGFRYHLPAYMRWSLRYFDSSDSFTTDSTIYILRLDKSDGLEAWNRERYEVFTEREGNVISRFLRFMVEQGDDRVDAAEAARALELYWGNFLSETA